MVSVWESKQWNESVAPQGPALLKIISDLGHDENRLAMVQAYRSSPASTLKMMKEATGCSEETDDVNYAWTSQGRMALLLEGMKPDDTTCKDDDFVRYDPKLRIYTADLGMMHERLMNNLNSTFCDSSVAGEEIEKELQEFHVDNICENGDWSNGVAVTPVPKFYIVTKWVKKYFRKYYDMANKLTFYKRPGTKGPPFLQIKKHRTCFLFKGREGPGSVFVNPEFAKEGANELRDDIPDEDFRQQVLTVEIIGGKGFEEFPNGLAGKLTCIGDDLFVIPMGPQQTKKFTPHSSDAFEDSYIAFRNSHPTTCT